MHRQARGINFRDSNKLNFVDHQLSFHDSFRLGSTHEPATIISSHKFQHLIPPRTHRPKRHRGRRRVRNRRRHRIMVKNLLRKVRQARENERRATPTVTRSVPRRSWSRIWPRRSTPRNNTSRWHPIAKRCSTTFPPREVGLGRASQALRRRPKPRGTTCRASSRNLGKTS